jgi:hypothetical protein
VIDRQAGRERSEAITVKHTPSVGDEVKFSELNRREVKRRKIGKFSAGEGGIL